MRVISITPISGGFEIREYQRGAHAVAVSRLGEPKFVSIGSPAWRIRGKRQRCGTYPLVCHCSNDASVTPRSRAPVSMDFQSSDVLMRSVITDKSSAYQRQIGGGNRLVDSLHLGMVKDAPSNAERRLAFRSHAKALMRAARESRGWSQKTAAKFLGLSKAAYEKLEGSADRGIPADLIPDICQLYDIDIEYMMTGAHSEKSARRSGRKA